MKDEQELYVKYLKALLKDIKDLNRDISCTWTGKHNTIKMSILPN